MATVSVGIARPFIEGKDAPGGATFELTDPYRNVVVATVASATPDEVARAIRAAKEAQPAFAAQPAHARAAILERAAVLLRERRDEIAPEISRQTGKPLKDTLREVNRAAETLRASADAGRQIFGEQPPADTMSGGEDLLAIVIRVPVGVVGGITPYNAPLNLVAHKVGPALAAGNAVVIKPASKAPLSALSLGKCLVDAGIPPACIAILPGGPEVGEQIATSPDVDLVTFTGGRPAGNKILASAGLKRVTLELGGNSATFVHEDADVPRAVERLTWGAFANAGQSCNSAQRIFVHKAVFDRFAADLAAAASRLIVGDPLDPASDLGTMVDEKEARRVEEWVKDAVAHGGKVITGGQRRGAAFVPTLLVDVPADRPLVCEEIFGPVAVLLPYEDIDEALARGNDTPYGLVGAVFTRSLSVSLKVARQLKVGSVMVNRPSNYRLDQLPYGGVKQSGIGREGPRYAIGEMTDARLVLIDG
jgi:acyl-CoA reductase-like NAD-dependent aldehyde dehydrogenase